MESLSAEDTAIIAKAIVTSTAKIANAMENQFSFFSNPSKTITISISFSVSVSFTVMLCGSAYLLFKLYKHQSKLQVEYQKLRIYNNQYGRR